MPTPAEILQQQLDQLNAQLDQINDQIVDLGDDLGNGLVKQLTKSVIEAKKLKDPLKDAESVSKKLVQLADDNAVLLNQVYVTEKNISKALQQGNQEEYKKLVAKRNQLNATLDINNAIQQELATLEDIGDIERARLEREKKIAEESQKQVSLADKIKNSYSLLEKIGLVAIFKQLYNIVIGIDQQLTTMGRTMGISKEAARDIRNEFEAYAKSAEDGFTTVQRLVKAQQSLTEQLGFGAKFSEEELETFARLTDIVGLTAGEAAKLTQNAAALGQSSKEYLTNIRLAATVASRANKVNISDKEVLSSIAKLSAGILVKFQGNPKALAEAVVQSKKLGTNLEQVDKTASSLLNFESSIGAELEAELITGRQLNFERARAAALTGDQAALMEEMAAQAGTLAEYQDMNVIAQQSLAQAFGMSRDEMADMLMKQEAINKFGNEAAQLNAKQLEDFEKSGLSLDDYLNKQKEQLSIQEKFNTAMTRLQEVVGAVVEGPFGRLLNITADLLSNTEALAAAAAIYITRLGVITVLKQKELAASRKIATTDAAGAAAKAAGSAASMGPLGWVLAGGAALGLFAILSNMLQADDMVSPGYGKRMIMSPEGTVALNDNDTIVAGTNLGGGGGGNNSGVMEAINNLASSLSRQPAPQFSLNVSGEQIGSVVGKQQSTGTQQVMGSYKLA